MASLVSKSAAAAFDGSHESESSPSSVSFFHPLIVATLFRRWKRRAPPRTEETQAKQEEQGASFDFSKPPPFTIAEIRAVIPKHCWVKDSWRSLSFVVRDIAIVALLAVLAAYFDSWMIWPLYWFAQGTMFWALFVLGHDCGHGSFSNSKKLNDFIGHLTHTFILVPFHGWRISHRTHHQNHGHVENDESWHPLNESTYRELDSFSRFGRFTPLSTLVYPLYLWRRSPGKSGSHFDPDSPLFLPSERKDVIMSTTCWFAMLAILIGFSIIMGPLWMLKLYAVPYLVNVIWLDFVTYLHHHGHEDKIPWYRGPEWNYLRGGLSTIDRDYGLFNSIHHNIETHVVHHLFPQIPHYHLVEATVAAKTVLGKFYRVPEKSGLFPLHLVKMFLKSLSQDHFIKDDGEILFYETDKLAKH